MSSTLWIKIATIHPTNIISLIYCTLHLKKIQANKWWWIMILYHCISVSVESAPFSPKMLNKLIFIFIYININIPLKGVTGLVLTDTLIQWYKNKFRKFKLSGKQYYEYPRTYEWNEDVRGEAHLSSAAWRAVHRERSCLKANQVQPSRLIK